MKRPSALALLLVATSSAAAPVLSGLYSVGELGLVDFSVADGKVIGKLKSSAQCVFPPDTQVITGAFEGNVFIGTVNLCQEGAACAGQRTYPMLGVFHGDSIAAFIHLDSGCTSPALDGKSLFFRPASLEDKQKVLGDNSAASVAGQKQNKKELAVIASEAFAEGNRLYADQKYGPAREKFRQSIQADDTMWEALLGFALTEIKLGRAQQSLEYFDKALAASGGARATPQKTSQIHYNRACAEVALGDNKAAVTSLRSALKLGGASLYIDDLATDPDLAKLRSDAEFRKMYAEALVAAKKKPQR
jgi:tetratricopeptide (TPR) repeat protein